MLQKAEFKGGFILRSVFLTLLNRQTVQYNAHLAGWATTEITEALSAEDGPFLVLLLKWTST